MSVGVGQTIDETDVEAVENLVENYQPLSEYGGRRIYEAAVRQQHVNPLLRAPVGAPANRSELR